VNLAVLDPELAKTVEGDFFEDVKQSVRLDLSLLTKRALLGFDESVFAHILERES
jgi:cardiolipin synthase